MSRTVGAMLLRENVSTAGVGSAAPSLSMAYTSNRGITSDESPVNTVNIESVRVAVAATPDRVPRDVLRRRRRVDPAERVTDDDAVRVGAVPVQVHAVVHGVQRPLRTKT